MNDKLCISNLGLKPDNPGNTFYVIEVKVVLLSWKLHKNDTTKPSFIKIYYFYFEQHQHYNQSGVSILL